MQNQLAAVTADTSSALERFWAVQKGMAGKSSSEGGLGTVRNYFNSLLFSARNNSLSFSRETQECFTSRYPGVSLCRTAAMLHSRAVPGQKPLSLSPLVKLSCKRSPIPELSWFHSLLPPTSTAPFVMCYHWMLLRQRHPCKG